MSNIWKPLSSFFFGANEAKEVNLGEKPKEKQDEPDEEAGDDQEEPDGESDEEQDEPDAEQEKPKKKPAADSISIKKAEYDALKKESAELKKFGATAKDRANLMADLGTLKAWYANAKEAGANPKTDANANKETPKKRQSSITAEAKAACDKSAARKGK